MIDACLYPEHCAGFVCDVHLHAAGAVRRRGAGSHADTLAPCLPSGPGFDGPTAVRTHNNGDPQVLILGAASQPYLPLLHERRAVALYSRTDIPQAPLYDLFYMTSSD